MEKYRCGGGEVELNRKIGEEIGHARGITGAIPYLGHICFLTQSYISHFLSCAEWKGTLH